uniref:Abhydrolase domain containing 15 n=1 Tax=Amphiprion percula TaxID=161767 RepID=A0A3P8TNU1_AMPPE
MASFLWDCFLLFLPSLLLVVLSVVLRRPRVHRWTRSAVRAAAWRLWVIISLILELPLDNNMRTWTAKPPGSESESAQASDGPRLICKPTALAKYLLRHCGSLGRSRLAGWPRGDPHLQTVSGLLCGQQGDTLQFTRDHLLLRDGGIVALDWAVGTRLGEARRRWEGRKEQQSGGKSLGCFTPTPPVLLLIPQSWGGMTPHLKALCHQAMLQGFYVVVFHPRGTASCPLTTARLTEFGDPADLEQAVSYVHSRHPSSVLVAVSEGSGSGILLSYLGECGSSTHLTAAATVSPVLQGQLWFETAMPAVYRWGSLFHRKLQLSRYKSSFIGVLDVDRALRCSSLRDFEETLFCSSDWESYWERNEPLRDADEVAVPVLCICSSDDPLLPPASTLPLQLFLSNPYFHLVLTDRGGHCGFTLEEEREGNWSHIVVLEYFRVVADFLRGEQRDGVLEENSPTGRRSWIRNVVPQRRRRVTMTRRTRTQNPEYVDPEEGEFTWKRSYTR